MAQRTSGKKVANSLVAVSSAAVLAVYAAGYVRTESAAKRLERLVIARQPAAPRQPVTAAPRAALQPAEPPVPSSVQAPEPPSNPVKELPRKPRSGEPAESIPAEAALPVASPEPLPAPPAPAPSPSGVVAEVIRNNAPATVAAEPKAEPAPVRTPAAPVWKDGTYTGWGTSRHGDIQATVVIEGGRIASAKIAQCLTRYSCDIIDKLPPQVAQRQSPETDYVSGATQSTDAFYYAVVEALGKAK